MEKLTQEQIKDIPLQTDPHYSDPRFDEPQTIFGQEESGLHYDYSDRLWQWDYDKAQKATEIANEVVKTRRTCEWYEAYLSAYHGTPVEIRHIVAGVNKSNGYPYLVFGYRIREKGEKP